MILRQQLLILALITILIVQVNSNPIVNPEGKRKSEVGVQLFQWPFKDIARECREILGPAGYTFVQTSPIQPHLRKSVPNSKGQMSYPWYLSYQPLGFGIGNRLGSEAEFHAMVQTCNKAGVKVIVDVVFNHLTGVGQEDESGGFGSDLGWSSQPFEENFPLTGLKASDFHDNVCNGDIQHWNSDFQVYNCRLLGLTDLDTGSARVQDLIVQFLADKLVLEHGVCGFRVDAAKHISQPHLSAIFQRVKERTGLDNLIIGLEIMGPFDSDGTYKEYRNIGRIYNFDYGRRVGQALRRIHGQDVASLEAYFQCDQIGSAASFTLIENHDKERDPDGYYNYATFSTGSAYQAAIAFNLLYPWGVPVIHSGYRFSYEPGVGEFPLSPNFDSKTGSIKSVFLAGNEKNWNLQHRNPLIVECLLKLRNELFESAGDVSNRPRIHSASDRVLWFMLANSTMVIINSKNEEGVYLKIRNCELGPGMYRNLVSEMLHGKEEMYLIEDDQSLTLFGQKFTVLVLQTQ